VKAGFFNNLQLKVTFVFLLVSLIPLGTVSIFSVRVQYGVYRRLIIADADGKIVYDSSGSPAASCAGEPWYRRAIGGQEYMSEIELGADGRESVFRLATPIRHADGRPRGVLCATASTQAVLRQILRVQLGETGECYLVDKSGTFLAHKDPKRILNENIARSGSFLHIFDTTKGRPVYTDIAISPEQSEDYQVAMRQVARIEKTIDHFLDFARPQQPVFTELDFVQLVDDVLEVIRPRANQQEVEIQEFVAAELPKVERDVRQLGEVLVNLLVNALDAMPDGGRLTISVAAEAAEPGSTAPAWVRIAVTDSGPGIQQKDLEHLLAPFFTTKAAGSGLGLAIVKGTLERHAGSVRVETQPGAGTTFSVRLPAAPA